MSSISYSSEIAPEPRLRRLVLAAGWTALLAGFLIILSLPVIGILRAVVATAWCAIVSAELRFISSAHKRFTGIRITSDGECALRNQNGHWEEAIIARSSVVLPQLAWLQLKPRSGGCLRELIAGDARESEQWRRLQVIWRHLGAAR